MKWWEHVRELEEFTHECGKCYLAGDCYCNDFGECCDTCYEVGDICEDCGKEVKPYEPATESVINDGDEV